MLAVRAGDEWGGRGSLLNPDEAMESDSSPNHNYCFALPVAQVFVRIPCVVEAQRRRPNSQAAMPRRFLTVSANIEKVFGMRAAGVANCSKKVSPAGSRRMVKFRKSHLCFFCW